MAAGAGGCPIVTAGKAIRNSANESFQASVQAANLNDLAKKARAHKGHRNLLIRAVTTFLSATCTVVLIVYDIDLPHKLPLLCSQLLSGLTLLIQWRTGRPSMFLCRACCNFSIALINAHSAVCGRNSLGGTCGSATWDTELRAMRISTCLSVFRSVCNGLSLSCQYRYPYIMFRGHGNLQLFCRGCVQLSGTFIGIYKFIIQLSIERGSKSEPEYQDLEIILGLITSCLLVPIVASSLFHQWWMTSAGKTGHAKSDAWERLMDPAVDCAVMRFKVSILSAQGLRNADFNGQSDPYCVCEVPGRPVSTWKTRVIDNSLSPVWNEGQELAKYRQNDGIKFTVFDSDLEITCCGIQLYNDQDDFLGEVTLPGKYFEENGFVGDLPLHKSGSGVPASVTIKIEKLNKNGEPVATETQATVTQDPFDGDKGKVNGQEVKVPVEEAPESMPRFSAADWLKLSDPTVRAIVSL